jgi:hypothetical protein
LAVFARQYDLGLWETDDSSDWTSWSGVNSAFGVAYSVDAVYNSPFQGTLGFEETSNVFDNSGAGYLIEQKTFGQSVVFTFADSTRVNQATGQLTFSDYSNAVIVAGPLANPTTAYYEANGFTPLTFSFVGGLVSFKYLGSTVFGPMPITSLTPTDDYFVMESFTVGGHIVIILYGINAPGTLASGVHLKAVLSTLINYPNEAFIINWQGSTPNVPFPTDTYKIVYSVPLV